ncbi:ribosomal L27 protein-domain-containing protein [Schizothecium vesticola]|uniref:Large ribosomal subunit protein bL27m n=1 Tax=Schizothecium vesticola TaxID=314040 RepID=A0AA40EL48_9PEZI|nr:ribosomal L27 protein-domain-containing protein [Schizothecium vesticola]
MIHRFHMTLPTNILTPITTSATTTTWYINLEQAPNLNLASFLRDTYPHPTQSNPFLASSTFLAASVSLNPPLDTHALDPSASSNLSSWSGHAHGQWCGKWTHAGRGSASIPTEQGTGNRHTQSIRTQVPVAVRARVVGLVQGRVAGVVLLLLLLVLVAAAAAKHLVEEAKLRGDGAREGEEEEGEGAHFSGCGCGRDYGFEGGGGLDRGGWMELDLLANSRSARQAKKAYLIAAQRRSRVTKQKIGRNHRRLPFSAGLGTSSTTDTDPHCRREDCEPDPMQIAQLRRPLQRVAAGSLTPRVQPTCLSERFAQLRIDSHAAFVVQGRRYASVKSQGAYRIPNKKTLPKKLGAKRTGDQYVIPGNIIYKQRGTIWHAGENALAGRDHTIHAAIAGYVKYYRDPLRHPKRQYIGVVYNKTDVLPTPVGAPRKRKLNLVAVPRRDPAPLDAGLGPSGIPFSVTRHEIIEEDTAPATPAYVTRTKKNPNRAPDSITDGNSVIATLLHDKLKARAAHEAAAEKRRAAAAEVLRARMGTRVFRLQDDYSYRETNWELGRLMNDVGSVAGTEKTDSRRAKFRLRRAKRCAYYGAIRRRGLEKWERRKTYKKNVWDKRVRMAAERAAKAQAERERGKGGEGLKQVEGDKEKTPEQEKKEKTQEEKRRKRRRKRRRSGTRRKRRRRRRRTRVRAMRPRNQHPRI